MLSGAGVPCTICRVIVHYISNIKLTLSGGGGLARDIWHMTEVAAFTVKSYCC